MLIDKVIKDFNKIDKVFGIKEDDFKDLTIVKIQNIADYMYMGTDQDVWSLENDFPNCAPPWRKFWLEWNNPIKCVSKKDGIISLPRSNNGVLVTVTNAEDININHLNDNIEFYFKNTKLLNNLDFLFLKKKMDFGWRVDFSYFADPQLNRQDYFLCKNTLLIRKDGSIYVTNLNHGKILDPMLLDSTKWPNKEFAQNVCDYVTCGFRPIALLAMSFCHCKNTEIVKNMIDTRLFKKRVADGKIGVNKFYTLEISGMRKILRDKGDVGSDGLSKKALHICRGHFKDFRGTKGLFGKHHDLYWWEMHSRGDSVKGEIKKDYEVVK